jgi:hypothetical protein
MQFVEDKMHSVYFAFSKLHQVRRLPVPCPKEHLIMTYVVRAGIKFRKRAVSWGFETV